GYEGPHLGNAGGTNQWPDRTMRLHARPDTQSNHSFCQRIAESVVYPRLHIDAVRAHAGLAGIAEFRCDRTLDGRVEIGIVEDDEGRIATQFQAEALDLSSALPQELAAHCR